MNGEVEILAVKLDGQDGLLVTFSDGTIGGYVVEELLGLRPVRERVEIKNPETSYYNVMFKSGGVRKRVTGRSLRGLRAPEVDWLWNLEQKRRVTPEELLKLCKGVSSVRSAKQGKPPVSTRDINDV